MLDYFDGPCGIRVINIYEGAMMKKDSLTKAKYAEWQASLFGAIFIAFGVGALWGNLLDNYIFIIILIGIALHSWGMYKIHQRNT